MNLSSFCCVVEAVMQEIFLRTKPNEMVADKNGIVNEMENYMVKQGFLLL